MPSAGPSVAGSLVAERAETGSEPEPGAAAGTPPQPVSTRCIASDSAGLTQSPYLTFTSICRRTYSHRYALFGGNQVAVSPSPFCLLVWLDTACRLSGSLARLCRSSGVKKLAPG